MNGMSPREEAAQDLLEVCIFGGLSDGPGALKTKGEDSKGKSYWSVTFCKARELDGEIKVYSERFILITWNTAYRDLPKSGREVFKSVHDARFFMRNFIRP